MAIFLNFQIRESKIFEKKLDL